MHSTYYGGFPSTVIPRGIALVELEAIVLVPSREQKGDSEGSKASILRVCLLVVADLLHHLLERHRLLVVVQVPLRREPRALDEDIGVCGESCHETGGVVVDGVGLF